MIHFILLHCDDAERMSHLYLPQQILYPLSQVPLHEREVLQKTTGLVHHVEDELNLHDWISCKNKLIPPRGKKIANKSD